MYDYESIQLYKKLLDSKKKKNDFIEISSYKNINFLTNILSHLN